MNLSRLLPILLLGLGAFACSKSEASTDAKGEIASSVGSSDGSSYENANYKVRLEVPPGAKKGEQAMARIVLETKGEYHINKQYPYKFVVQQPASPSIRYPKATLTRDDGAFEERKAVLQLPFVVDDTGSAKVGGVFSLSVCTDANCLLDKRSLEVSVHAE